MKSRTKSEVILSGNLIDREGSIVFIVLWWPYVDRAQSVYNGACTCDRICMPYSGLVQYTSRKQAVQ